MFHKKDKQNHQNQNLSKSLEMVEMREKLLILLPSVIDLGTWWSKADRQCFRHEEAINNSICQAYQSSGKNRAYTNAPDTEQ